jgi:hypothetical protein
METKDIDLSLRIKTNNPDKVDVVLDDIFAMLLHDVEITRIGLDVK